MHFSDMRKICEQHIEGNWTNTSIAYDNIKFEVPTVPWIRGTLRPLLTENAALGGLAKRDYIVFMVQIFVPLNTGTGLAYEYAAEIEDLFSNKQLSGITFYSSETSYSGDDGNGWFVINVRAKGFATTSC